MTSYTQGIPLFGWPGWLDFHFRVWRENAGQYYICPGRLRSVEYDYLVVSLIILLSRYSLHFTDYIVYSCQYGETWTWPGLAKKSHLGLGLLGL